MGGSDEVMIMVYFYSEEFIGCLGKALWKCHRALNGRVYIQDRNTFTREQYSKFRRATTIPA